MAIMKDTIDREGVYSARADVSANPASRGIITFSLNAYTEAQGGGSVFLRLSPMDAEILASLLLRAAITRRAHDETDADEKAEHAAATYGGGRE